MTADMPLDDVNEDIQSFFRSLLSFCQRPEPLLGFELRIDQGVVAITHIYVRIRYDVLKASGVRQLSLGSRRTALAAQR